MKAFAGASVDLEAERLTELVRQPDGMTNMLYIAYTKSA
jgi:hypothetical protein